MKLIRGFLRAGAFPGLSDISLSLAMQIWPPFVVLTGVRWSLWFFTGPHAGVFHAPISLRLPEWFVGGGAMWVLALLSVIARPP